MYFQHLCAKKVKLNGLKEMQHYLQKFNSKELMNVDMCLTPKNLARKVEKRILELKLKKHPRSDAVGIEDILVSTSADFMKESENQVIEEYFLDSLKFFQARYGKENVMYCQCHIKEKVPHIHIGIVPITADGRLSARDLFNPKTLEILQGKFHKEVSSKYGLVRGESSVEKYIEFNNFKIEQSKLEIEVLAEDLNLARINGKEVNRIKAMSHSHLVMGIDYMELEKENYDRLCEIASEGVKAKATIHKLKWDKAKCEIENQELRGENEYLARQIAFYKEKYFEMTE